MFVTARLNQINCGTSMVAWRILFHDDDGDVVVVIDVKQGEWLNDRVFVAYLSPVNIE